MLCDAADVSESGYYVWRNRADRATTEREARRLELSETLPRYRALETAIRAGIVRSVAVVAKGGLGVSFARMALASRLGLELDLTGAADLAGLDPDVALFSESLGRLLVSVAPAFTSICAVAIS